jgi:hypothetical protein
MRAEQTTVEENALAMTEETKPKYNPSEARDGEELRDMLFDALDDLRAGRITSDEAKAVSTAANKVLCGGRKIAAQLKKAARDEQG